MKFSSNIENLGTETAGSLNLRQDENYIRLAYSGINSEAINEGLISFKNWIEN